MAKGRILLLFPPTSYQVKGSVEGSGVRRSRALTPHLGLLYLASELQSADYDVEFCDFTAQEYSREVLAHKLRGSDLVGITMQSFNRDSVHKILIDVKGIAPSMPVMVGGPDCILHPRLVDMADVTVYGEAESTIVDISDAMLQGGDLSQCEGVLYRNNDTIRRGKEPSIQKDLDMIRFPAREIVNPLGYDIVGKSLTPKIATIITTRGCPYRCTFCARNALLKRYRERSVENVLAEIEHIYEAGYQFLAFVDEELLIKKRRIERIMQGIIDRGIKLRMVVQGRADSVDDELFGLMKEAGVRGIIFGLESGNQETLNYFNKRLMVAHNQRAVELADKYNLFSFGFFILGAPVETEYHIQTTLDFAMSVPLDGATFNILDFTYGAELWERAFRNGLIRENEFNVPADKSRGLSHFSKTELDKICTKAFDQFYKRPSLWMRYLRKTLKLQDLWVLRIIPQIGARLVKDFLG